ncbi:hypothetical protein D3C71_1672190 [compost metagenome]
MRNGPMAKPNFSMALSTCWGVAPSSSRKPAWRLYCSIMRLPMKPSHTPDTTEVFLIFLPMAITVASTSLDVALPRTTSSSFITLAGLKKCMPTTSCGRSVNEAILSTSSVEVFEARMAPFLATRSSSLKTFSLTPISSNTASMMRSASFRSS